MTDKPFDDDDFKLNKLDIGEDEHTDTSADENRTEENSEFIKTESFYTADLFEDAKPAPEPEQKKKEDPFDATWGAQRFAEHGYGRKEPVISDDPEPEDEETGDPDQAAGESESSNVEDEAIIPPVIPPASDDLPPPPPTEERSGAKTTTLFAITAMLVAAIAVWLNTGSDSGEESSDQYSTQTVLGSDVQMQRMERRIASLEEQSKSRNEALTQQINDLEQQISSLTSLLAEQTRKQQSAVRAAKKTASKPAARNTPVTRPVRVKTATGWVINLISVDSKYAAEKALASYKAKGIPAEISSSKVKGKTWYRIRVSGFSSQQEASAQKEILSKKYGIKDAWIHKPS